MSIYIIKSLTISIYMLAISHISNKHLIFLSKFIFYIKSNFLLEIHLSNLIELIHENTFIYLLVIWQRLILY